MDVEVRLIALHINFEQSSQQIMLDGEKLPSCVVDGDIDLKSLMKQYFIIDPDWVTFMLVDVMIENNILILYYTCLVPAVLQNKIGHWTDIGKIHNEHIQKVVFEAGHKIIARQ